MRQPLQRRPKRLGQLPVPLPDPREAECLDEIAGRFDAVHERVVLRAVFETLGVGPQRQPTVGK